MLVPVVRLRSSGLVASTITHINTHTETERNRETEIHLLQINVKKKKNLSGLMINLTLVGARVLGSASDEGTTAALLLPASCFLPGVGFLSGIEQIGRAWGLKSPPRKISLCTLASARLQTQGPTYLSDEPLLTCDGENGEGSSVPC